MDLKVLFKENFNIDLPISGGRGNSIDTPIVIHLAEFNDYVGMEYYILRLLCICRQCEWKMLGQELLKYNGKMIDKMKIETKLLAPIKTITQVENYYFDITECYGRHSNGTRM